jgi:glycosyltransferase involved in cell wall biosynthesis
MTLPFLRGQVRYVRSLGFRVWTFSSAGPEVEPFAAQEGAEARVVPMTRRISPLADLRSLLTLISELRRVDPHVVHSHTPKGGLLGMLAATLLRVPVRIYHMRGLVYPTATGYRRTLLRTMERVSCALSHRVICVSHSLREEALRDGLCAPEKIRVLLGGSGQGVDADARFAPATYDSARRDALRASLGIPVDAPVIGFVGRILRDKGVVVLAEAWSALRAEFPAAHLVLIGPIEDRNPIPPAVRAALEADDRVHLLGHAGDTAPYYTIMDVLALPTYREGFPNVLLEAGAMEVPVVATRVAGCVDAVREGETGTLVEPGDALGLAEGLRRYLNDPALRRAHGAEARARVLREFRREAIWEAIGNQYLELLGRRGLHRPAKSLSAVRP